MKVNVLAIGAHPDDVELGCGATLAKIISNGKKVAIIDLTLGELGTRGNSKIRRKEALEAAQILGIHQRVFLNFSDGFIESNKENILTLISWIRFFQPEILLTNPPHDRHPDHGTSYDIVRKAAFLSGLPKVRTYHDGKQQVAWKVKQTYRYIQWNMQMPDFVVDVTGFEEIKIKACQAYASQFYRSGSEEPETPISTQNFWESIRYRMRDLGRLIGTEYAEGFTAERIIAVKNLLDLI